MRYKRRDNYIFNSESLTYIIRGAMTNRALGGETVRLSPEPFGNTRPRQRIQTAKQRFCYQLPTTVHSRPLATELEGLIVVVCSSGRDRVQCFGFVAFPLPFRVP